MSGLHGNMVVEAVAQVHVLNLHLVVGEIDVKLREPFLIERSLQGQSGPADTHTVVETELAVILLQIIVRFR